MCLKTISLDDILTSIHLNFVDFGERRTRRIFLYFFPCILYVPLVKLVLALTVLYLLDGKIRRHAFLLIIDKKQFFSQSKRRLGSLKRLNKKYQCVIQPAIKPAPMLLIS